MKPKYISAEKSSWLEMRSWAHRKTVQGETCTLAINKLGEREATKLHSHPHEQITYVLCGSTDFVVGERRLHISAGDVLVIPPDVPHGGGSGACTMLDFFAPKREDFVECEYTDEEQ